MTLIGTLKETPTKELLRAYHSEKEYFYFNISVFNTGASIYIICSNTFKEVNQKTWNGYDFVIENDSTTNYYIKEVLIERLAVWEEEDLPKVSTLQAKRIQLIINSIA